MHMLLGGGFKIGGSSNIGRCGQYEMFRPVSRALLWFGSRGGLLGSTPSKNEVSGQLCLPVRSDLHLFADIGDFAAILRETNWFVFRSDNTGTLSIA
jgi:hypothetical protein